MGEILYGCQTFEKTIAYTNSRNYHIIRSNGYVIKFKRNNQIHFFGNDH